jgi:hypothetical protein
MEEHVNIFPQFLIVITRHRDRDGMLNFYKLKLYIYNLQGDKIDNMDDGNDLICYICKYRYKDYCTHVSLCEFDSKLIALKNRRRL